MRLAVVAIAGLVLAGCTGAGWNHSFAYLERHRASPPPAPARVAAPDPAWCAEVARSARAEAADQGFDAATQQRRSDTIYAQCLRTH